MKVHKIESNNYIIHGDCFEGIDFLKSKNAVVNCVLTSPPYNTSRVGAKDKINSRYDSFKDKLTDEEYIEWTIKLFNEMDTVLENNGTILYNLSYSSENTDLIWKVIFNVINSTNFTTADTITWKKKSAVPNNRSANKLTRICEFIFVFVRKNEMKTFKMNKKVVSQIEKNGQNNYENIYNFIEAKNNDGSCELNKATFSTDLCTTLLNRYTSEGDRIFDPFSGTGTTSLACKLSSRKFFGTELSEAQVEYTIDRVRKAN